MRISGVNINSTSAIERGEAPYTPASSISKKAVPLLPYQLQRATNTVNQYRLEQQQQKAAQAAQKALEKTQPLHVEHPKPRIGTDIVLGDTSYCDASTQFVTTAGRDFHAKQDFSKIPGAAKSKLTFITPSRGVVVDNTMLPPAGKPLGIDTANKRADHISFGDARRRGGVVLNGLDGSAGGIPGNGMALDDGEDDAYKTVSGQAFKYRGKDLSKEEALSLPSTLASSTALTPAQRFHAAANPTTSNQKHTGGLRTRHDLPIDDTHFKSYTTTHQDAYHVNHDTAARAIDATTANTAHSFGASNRASTIPFGNKDQVKEYATIAGGAWVRHPVEAYLESASGIKLVKKGPRSTSGLTKMNRGAAGSHEDDTIDGDSKNRTFVSLTQLSYPPPPDATYRRKTADGSGGPAQAHVLPPSAIPDSHRRGFSSIQFGSAPGNGAAGTTAHDEPAQSQSRATYIPYPDAYLSARTALRSGLEDRLVSKRGIQNAVRPVNKSLVDTSSMQAAYVPPSAPQEHDKTKLKAAGVSLHAPSSNYSSVPTGDSGYFPIATGARGDAATTAASSYPHYPPELTSSQYIRHPVLGARITESTFRIGYDGDDAAAADNGSGAAPPRVDYTTSTQRDYTPKHLDHAAASSSHTRHIKHAPSLPPIGDPATRQLPFERTTNQIHYRPPPAPTHPGIAAPPAETWPTLPAPVAPGAGTRGRYANRPRIMPNTGVKALLFPANSGASVVDDVAARYATTTGKYFRDRGGLWDVHGHGDHGAAKPNNASSVVFGDPRLGYFRDRVVERGVPAMTVC
ncbi:uncharacterized protein EV422DRAFT_124673 [Fimicolochytrium jonesii]|uniref:uncharacterized protein n=1 Tax=Fimicolochytrium jonesii TaxID=1396493 RepID=UPI0022FEC92E|nr:uncharacterized protein EV422DRAFT_124673 [Fimicolochytrium jonesii]KAI8818908.1 hypothetical protein EV422DRAFT_124673 [Fimicolochytrium jonesii]